MVDAKKYTFAELRSIDVSEFIEKKGKLTYLSWVWAVDTLLMHDGTATWEYGEPVLYAGTMMVSCSVHAFGKTMTCHLPVMNHTNKAVANPDAFAVNTAMQRCLVKAIALHGIGLHIYAGEDLPVAETATVKTKGTLGEKKPEENVKNTGGDFIDETPLEKVTDRDNLVERFKAAKNRQERDAIMERVKELGLSK